jgi:hypothetical protein
MDAPATAKRSRADLPLHLLPAALAWAYVFWIVLDGVCGWHFARLLASLFPLQLLVAALSAFGGVWAFSLPSRWRRIGVSVASLLAAMLLVALRVEVRLQIDLR